MRNKIKNITERSFITETASGIFSTSFLLPVVTFPIKECYKNWKKVFNDEYQIRSLIRATVITSSFAVGPILIQFGNASWLYGRAYSLYTGLPILNQLPETPGVIISSSFIFSYFCAWLITHTSNIFNHFKFGGAEHYLTPNKKQELLNIIKNNKFYISIKELEEIFNKINIQLRKDPNNRDLNNLIISLRQGDLQTVLDKAQLLETEIMLVNKKIRLLNNNTQSMENPQLFELQEQTISGVLPPRNSISQAVHCTTEEEEDNNIITTSIPEPQRIAHSVTGAQAFLPGERDIIPMPAEAIIHQYKNKSKKNKLALRKLHSTNTNPDIHDALHNLHKHKNDLETQRFIDLKHQYTIS